MLQLPHHRSRRIGHPDVDLEPLRFEVPSNQPIPWRSGDGGGNESAVTIGHWTMNSKVAMMRALPLAIEWKSCPRPHQAMGNMCSCTEDHGLRREEALMQSTEGREL